LSQRRRQHVPELPSGRAPCRCQDRSLQGRCEAKRCSLYSDPPRSRQWVAGKDRGMSDPRIASGQEPQWRMAWEESLTDSERAQVSSAVGSGQAVEDPRLAVFAVGLASKARRRARLAPWIVLFHAAITSGWIYIACIREEALARSPLWCGFWLLIGAALLTVVPMRLLKAKARATEAYRANRELLDLQGNSDVRKPGV
jgi:hypothetical protein